jgi:RNA polymerase sigma-B factor
MKRISLPVRVEAAARARQALAENAPLDRIRLAEAQLMVTEAVANALHHAQLDRSSSLALTVDADPARVRVGVEHEAAAPIDLETVGMGFTLISRLARRWGTEWNRKVAEVWFEVRSAGTGEAISHLSDDEVLAKSLDDDRYRDEAVTRFGNLAAALARRFRGKGIPEPDLEQVALVGLLNAIARYEPDKGAFEPFAVATIQGELKRHLRDKAWSVRVPRGLQERSLLVGRTLESLAQTLGRAVTSADVARELGLPEEEVVEAIAANSAYRWESIDAPNEESGISLAETIHEEDDWSDRLEDWQELTDAIRTLPERDRHILYLRFFRDQTQAEIAAQMGISQMHVSRLIARALERLREGVG